MNTNDLIRRIRYAASLSDKDTVRITALGGVVITSDIAAAWRLADDADGFLGCGDAEFSAFMKGLITDRRGPRESPAEQPPLLMVNGEPDNNGVLKQLRVALKLRSDEVHSLINAGGGSLSKTETSAFFRKPETRNYRRCGDQVMRWFLKGLASQREQN